MPQHFTKNPSGTAKFTSEIFQTPGVSMEGYTTKTFHEGKSPVEAVVNGFTGKPESTTIKTSTKCV